MRPEATGIGHVLIYEPYPFGRIAGNLRTLLYILRLTDRNRFRLTLVVPFATELPKALRDTGIRYVVLAPPARLNRYGGRVLGDRWYHRLLHLPAMLWYNARVWSFLRKERVDVVYCNGIRALLTVGVACRLSGTPMVWYVKGALGNGVLDRIGFILARRILFFCATNRDDKYPWLVRLFRRKIEIVKIGLDVEELRRTVEAADPSAIAASLGFRDDIVPIAYVGQLYPPKGVHILVEALARVVREYPKVRLYVIGHPVLDEFRAYEDRLRAQVAEAGLQDHVVFTGWRDDALALVSQMAIIVHPSFAEGFGRAVLEAMAFGRPVIASAVGGLREAIRDGENGMLVPPGSVRALADRLLLLLKDPTLRARLGHKARETVDAEYLIHDKIADLSNVWADVIRQRL